MSDRSTDSRTVVNDPQIVGDGPVPNLEWFRKHGTDNVIQLACPSDFAAPQRQLEGRRLRYDANTGKPLHVYLDFAEFESRTADQPYRDLLGATIDDLMRRGNREDRRILKAVALGMGYGMGTARILAMLRPTNRWKARKGNRAAAFKRLVVRAARGLYGR